MLSTRAREDPYYLELRFGADMAAPEKTDVAAMQERSSTARKTGAAVEGGCTFYDAEWQRTQLREKELVNRLDASLQAGDFRVYFQPKVRLEDRRVAGAEALIRWQHPTKGMLSPAVFVPVFEKYRLITRLDQFIFEQVCLSAGPLEGRGTGAVHHFGEPFPPESGDPGFSGSLPPHPGPVPGGPGADRV